MPQAEHIDNRSPCVVLPFTTDDRLGREVFVVIAKMTYVVAPGGEVRLPTRPAPVRITPVPAGDGPWASHRLPSDCVDEKPGTDLVLVGTAHPPAARVRDMDVALRVSARDEVIEKHARVYGPRVWEKAPTGVAPSKARWLEPTPLVYEHAYGGRDESDPERPLIDLRNPAGSGVARDPSALVGRPTPSVEDPSAPLRARLPAPAGFGPIASSWEPRRSFAGTYDEQWRRWRAPVRPTDFDPRHQSVASLGLWSVTPLAGDEPVAVLGASPDGPWPFQLPRFRPTFVLRGHGSDQPLPSHLDTYLIDADEGRVELTWRVALPMPRQRERFGTVVVEGEGDGNFDAVLGYSLIEMARHG